MWLLAVLATSVVGCADGGHDDGDHAEGDRAGASVSSTGDPSDTTAGTGATEPGGTAAPHAEVVSAETLCAEAVADSSGAVTVPELTEISGVVAGSGPSEVLWVHNDSGATNLIWALGPDGAVSGRFMVQGAEAIDWEDIAIDASSSGEPASLYLADTGDNFAAARSADDPPTIYRIPEPDVSATLQGADAAADATERGGEATEGSAEATERAEAFTISYGDGAHDVEALISDPLTGDVFVITKQWDGTASGVFRLPAGIVRAPTAPEEPTPVERVAEVASTAGMLVTAADISRDGTLIALRSYGDVLLWDRDPQRSVAETLANPPTCTRPVEEHQGEAVGFDPDGRGLVTIGEGEDAPVNRLRLP